MSAVTNLPSTGMGQILISKDIENLFERADKHRKQYGDSFISIKLASSFFDENKLQIKKYWKKMDLI